MLSRSFHWVLSRTIHRAFWISSFFMRCCIVDNASDNLKSCIRLSRKALCRLAPMLKCGLSNSPVICRCQPCNQEHDTLMLYVIMLLAIQVARSAAVKAEGLKKISGAVIVVSFCIALEHKYASSCSS